MGKDCLKSVPQSEWSFSSHQNKNSKFCKHVWFKCYLIKKKLAISRIIFHGLATLQDLFTVGFLLNKEFAIQVQKTFENYYTIQEDLSAAFFSLSLSESCSSDSSAHNPNQLNISRPQRRRFHSLQLIIQTSSIFPSLETPLPLIIHLGWK